LRAWSTSPTTHPPRRRIDHTLPPSQVCRQQHGRLPVGAALYSEPRRDSLRRGVEIYSTATLCMKIHDTISSGDGYHVEQVSWIRKTDPGSFARDSVLLKKHTLLDPILSVTILV
jgi:hypothetical protein